MLYLFNDKGVNTHIFWYDSTNEHGHQYGYFSLNLGKWTWWAIDDFDFWLSDYLWENESCTVSFQD